MPGGTGAIDTDTKLPEDGVSRTGDRVLWRQVRAQPSHSNSVLSVMSQECNLALRRHRTAPNTHRNPFPFVSSNCTDPRPGVQTPPFPSALLTGYSRGPSPQATTTAQVSILPITCPTRLSAPRDDRRHGPCPGVAGRDIHVLLVKSPIGHLTTGLAASSVLLLLLLMLLRHTTTLCALHLPLCALSRPPCHVGGYLYLQSAHCAGRAHHMSKNRTAAALLAGKYVRPS